MRLSLHCLVKCGTVHKWGMTRIYIYIYLYICVYMRVCVYANKQIVPILETNIYISMSKLLLKRNCDIF